MYWIMFVFVCFCLWFNLIEQITIIICIENDFVTCFKLPSINYSEQIRTPYFLAQKISILKLGKNSE